MTHEEEFEEFFESRKFLLKMALVPPKTDVELLLKGWMKQAYLAGRQNHIAELEAEATENCEDANIYKHNWEVTEAARQKDEKERALIREVVKEGLRSKLSELSALWAIHTIVNPAEPDKDDLEWARDSRARGGGTNNEREKSEGSEKVGLEG